jgi:lipoprotein-anchoring transpeptidase ErfK/SrfK
MHCLTALSRHNYATSESSRARSAVACSLRSSVVFTGEIMRRNLIRAALMAGLFLSAGAAPVLANALDSQLQPIAAPIPRETVPFDGRESPGTIIIRTGERRLYLVMPDHQALKYGVGVGRPGFTWAGVTRIGYKREWPDWTPPAQMLRRRPDLPRHMDGGPDNPLGARALYLAARSIVSMAPMNRIRSGTLFHQAASA